MLVAPVSRQLTFVRALIYSVRYGISLLDSFLMMDDSCVANRSTEMLTLRDGHEVAGGVLVSLQSDSHWPLVKLSRCEYLV